MKERLDVLLVKRNLAASREKAKAIIMSGNVYVDNQKEDKPGTTFPEESKIEVRGHTLPYVSRGGLKLEKAMKEFDRALEYSQTNEEKAMMDARYARFLRSNNMYQEAIDCLEEAVALSPNECTLKFELITSQ